MVGGSESWPVPVWKHHAKQGAQKLPVPAASLKVGPGVFQRKWTQRTVFPTVNRGKRFFFHFLTIFWPFLGHFWAIFWGGGGRGQGFSRENGTRGGSALESPWSGFLPQLLTTLFWEGGGGLGGGGGLEVWVGGFGCPHHSRFGGHINSPKKKAQKNAPKLGVSPQCPPNSWGSECFRKRPQNAFWIRKDRERERRDQTRTKLHNNFWEGCATIPLARGSSSECSESST